MNNDNKENYFFPPIGHPEHHFNKYQNHPWLKSEKEIKEWIDLNVKLDCKYRIHDDLTVTIENDGYLNINNEFFKIKINKIPFQITYCSKIYINNDYIESLIGTPIYIDNSISINMKKLKTLEGLSGNIETSLKFMEGCEALESFIGMPKILNKINVYIENKINCWDWFTNAEVLIYEKSVYNDVLNKKMIFTLPKSIKKMILIGNLNVNEWEHVKKISFSRTFMEVDMSWLRNEQYKIKKSKELSNEIEEFTKDNKNIKKRKV